jgi:hypothetical protein
MATLVRCIEGHAFDRAASETCPICGSTVWKNEPVIKSRAPPWDRTKAKQAAVSVGYLVASIVFVGATINIAHDIWTSNFVKSVIDYVWDGSYVWGGRDHPPPPKMPPQKFSDAPLEVLHACEERKLHDLNVVCSFREALERDKAAREREHSCEERKLHDPNVVCSFRAVAPPGTFDPNIRFGPK